MPDTSEPLDYEGNHKTLSPVHYHTITFGSVIGIMLMTFVFFVLPGLGILYLCIMWQGLQEPTHQWLAAAIRTWLYIS